jgi:hypothetical protein
MIALIPWNPTLDQPKREKEWWTLDEPERELLEEFYHIVNIGERNRLHMHVYKRTNGTERLTRVSGPSPVQLPTWKLTRARTILQRMDFLDSTPQRSPPIGQSSSSNMGESKIWNWTSRSGFGKPVDTSRKAPSSTTPPKEATKS